MSESNFRIHREHPMVKNTVYPWVATEAGWYPMDALSEKAIEWLNENEPGFQEASETAIHNSIGYQERMMAEARKPIVKKERPPISATIYIIYSPEAKCYKIGISGDPIGRVKGIQVSSPFKLKLMATFQSDDAERDEAAIHRKLKKYHSSGEWFKVPDIEIINKAIQKHGIVLEPNKYLRI